MRIQYFGHSCFLVEIGGKRLLFDPFISGNELAQAIDPASIRTDYIFISHAHDDHIADAETVAKNNPDAVIVSNWELAEFYGKKGYRWHPMNIGGPWRFDFGRAKMVAAVHSSSFSDENRRYAGNPGGFLLECASTGRTLYFAGDTALTLDMQLIPMFWPALDIAIMPIGSNFTMDAAEAAIAADFVKCQKIIGCHYDTFDFIKIDHEASKTTFEKTGKELVLMSIGSSIEIY